MVAQIARFGWNSVRKILATSRAGSTSRQSLNHFKSRSWKALGQFDKGKIEKIIWTHQKRVVYQFFLPYHFYVLLRLNTRHKKKHWVMLKPLLSTFLGPARRLSWSLPVKWIVFLKYLNAAQSRRQIVLLIPWTMLETMSSEHQWDVKIDKIDTNHTGDTKKYCNQFGQSKPITAWRRIHRSQNQRKESRCWA